MRLILYTSAALAADLWTEDTEAFVPGGVRDGWTNEVEVGDLDGDGHLDVVLVNGDGYSTPGRAEASRLFLNPNGGPPLVDASAALGAPAHARTAKIRDFDRDGTADLLLVHTYQERSRLLLGDGKGGLVDVSATHLPPVDRSFGDGEPADVDLDGDLDLVLAHWGPGDALSNGGGPILLWRNDGTGHFTEETSAFPAVRVGMSWDLEAADLDLDDDLDVLVSCKVCDHSYLFLNDGAGTFADHSAALPARPNNYDVELADLDGDLDLDVTTINDGRGLRESVWLNDGSAGFSDATKAWMPGGTNRGDDDNVSAWLDVDDDGDQDWLIGSLSGPDRVLVNEGTRFTLEADALSRPRTPGTLGLALGDLDEDGRLDVVTGQGEVLSPDHVWRGVGVALDTHPPVVELAHRVGDRVRARVHDRISPVTPDTVRVVLRTELGEVPTVFHGGSTFSAALPAAVTTWQLCATDRLGAEACSAVEVLPGDTGSVPTDTNETGSTATTGETGSPTHSGGGDTGDDDSGSVVDDPPSPDGACGCATGRPGPVLGVFALAAVHRRRSPSRPSAASSSNR